MGINSCKDERPEPLGDFKDPGPKERHTVPCEASRKVGLSGINFGELLPVLPAKAL